MTQLLIFLTVLHPLPLFLFCARPSLQSDVSCCKFVIFTLQYSQVNFPPVIILFFIIPWSTN